MKITYNWLKEFISTDLTPDDIAEKITLAGVEVDSVTEINSFLKDVVVAEISEINKVSDSEKLSLCKVYDGSETYDIVCGAKNMKKGDKVALAKIGAVLPGNFKIKKSKIRGVVSYGMLCSEKELGLAEDSAGIMILEQDAPLGTSVGDYYKLFDTVIEYEITPNRGDCLSVLGMARELSAITGIPVKLPRWDLKETDEIIDQFISIDIIDKDLCPRYTARVIRDITIKDSPLWLKNRLIAVELRPINNIVDITNYVMYELGQPLHAFDYQFIQGKKIVVKKATEGLKFKTLDSKEHTLRDFNLLICDNEKPVALGGIMGGENSEVHDKTQDILLEAAFFNPLNIRKSAKSLGIQSEAAYRFERSVDIDFVPLASKRAAYLMQELAQGKVVKGLADNYPVKYSPKKITLREKRLNSIAGQKTDFKLAENILNNLGFKIYEISEDKLIASPPSFRNDIFTEIDLIEEILRINGYDKIKGTLPPTNVYPEYLFSIHDFTDEMKDFFKNAGFNEAVNYSFLNGKLNSLFDENAESHIVKLLNPLNEELEVMRTSLLGSLLKNVKENINLKNESVKLFEVGKVFFKDETSETGVKEIIKMEGVACGRVSEQIWCNEDRNIDFFDIKGVFEELLHIYNIKEFCFEYPENKDFPFLNCNKSALIKINSNDILGFIGEIHPDILEKLDIDTSSVFCFSIDMENLYNSINRNKSFSEIDRFPSLDRDIALLADINVQAGDIEKTIKEVGGKLVENILPFDLYLGKNIPEGKKSIAFKIIFRDKNTTLKAEKINKIVEKILQKLKEKFNIQIR